MKKSTYTTTTNNKRRGSYFAILVLVILSVGVVSILVLNSFDVFDTKKTDKPSASEQKNNTSKTSPASPNTVDNAVDKQATSPTTTNNDITVKDNSGTINTTPDQSKWLVSKDGVITLYSPAANAQLKNGSVLSGKTTAKSVSFRLIDNVQGVVSQGEVSVVNGNFSATFQFSTTATQGRLDVYVVNPDFTESSIIEVPIKF